VPVTTRKDRREAAFLFVAVHESAYGPKRTFNFCSLMSAIGGKADISQLKTIVQSLLTATAKTFVFIASKSVHLQCETECPLWANSGSTRYAIVGQGSSLNRNCFNHAISNRGRYDASKLEPRRGPGGLTCPPPCLPPVQAGLLMLPC
jgi:hypothetical protein